MKEARRGKVKNVHVTRQCTVVKYSFRQRQEGHVYKTFIRIKYNANEHIANCSFVIRSHDENGNSHAN